MCDHREATMLWNLFQVPLPESDHLLKVLFCLKLLCLLLVAALRLDTKHKWHKTVVFHPLAALAVGSR